MKNFGERLTTLRKGKNLTQEELGKKLNITGQAVSKYENNQSLPDIDMLVEISKVFEVSCDYLCGEESIVNVRENVDINKLILKIYVESKSDTVKLNIPFSIIVFLLKTNSPLPKVNKTDILNEIDWDSIFEMIKLGTVGQIAEVKSGDDLIRIIIE